MTRLFPYDIQRVMIALRGGWHLACFAALVLSLHVEQSRAQEFAITRTELTANSIILHYDLIDSTRSRIYTIAVYSSRDNFASPLQKVTGDAGLEVRPGKGKKITWSAKEELGATFAGEVELEIRGRVYIPFIKFTNLENGNVIKRGKQRTLLWSGGTRQNILNFNIYNGKGELVEVIPNVANAGSYDLILPTTVKPGKDYYFLVSDSKNKDQVMKSPTFEVRRKIPLLAKAIPLVVIGAVIALLPKSSGSKDLNGPPDVPAGKN